RAGTARKYRTAVAVTSRSNAEDKTQHAFSRTFGDVNLFKAWGFLPLLVELEKSACPHKYRMDLIFPLFFFTEKPAWVP
ncbi:MAG: hypothetical protein ACKPHU_07615, partial [Planctomycetaceae bacterium]